MYIQTCTCCIFKEFHSLSTAFSILLGSERCILQKKKITTVTVYELRGSGPKKRLLKCIKNLKACFTLIIPVGGFSFLQLLKFFVCSYFQLSQLTSQFKDLSNYTNNFNQLCYVEIAKILTLIEGSSF